jgi:hypothetical protein
MAIGCTTLNIMMVCVFAALLGQKSKLAATSSQIFNRDGDSEPFFLCQILPLFFYLLTSGLQQLIQLLCQLLQHIIVLNTNQVNELDVLITALNSEDLNGFKFEKAIESINEIHADAGL